MAAALVAASLSANAQVYVGGGLSVHSYDNASDYKKNTIEIIPEVGYNIDDKLAIGAEFGYSHTGFEGDVKSDMFKFEPYLRYTFAKWNNVSLFGEFTVGYQYDKASVEKEVAGQDVEVSTKTNTWSVGVRPGVSVDVTNHLSFVTRFGWLGYKNSKVKDADKSQGDFGLDVTANKIQFGLVYNF